MGLPVSVGIAETKTLAKVANYHAKRSEKAQGVLDLFRAPYLEAALARTPVEEVLASGHSMRRRYQKRASVLPSTCGTCPTIGCEAG